jgi:hypothetical protein
LTSTDPKIHMKPMMQAAAATNGTPVLAMT